MAQLPRSKNKDDIIVVRGRLWDQLCDKVEGNSKLAVSRPLFMSQGPEGTTIGALFPGVNVVALKLIANETGGGFYSGTQLAGVASLASGTNVLAEPISGMSVPTNGAVLVFNPSEDGQSTHVLSPTSQATFGAGMIVGQTTESPPRPIAMWLGGGTSSGGVQQGYCGKTSGNDGNESGPATWAYNVSNTAFVSVATNKTVLWHRPTFGSMTPGTNCLYIGTGSNTVLLNVDEQVLAGCS